MCGNAADPSTKCAVNVAACNSDDLRMALHDGSELCGAMQTFGIHQRNADLERWMVHEDKRRPAWQAGERGVKPREPFGVEYSPEPFPRIVSRPMSRTGSVSTT